MDLIVKILQYIRETESENINGHTLEDISLKFNIEKEKNYKILKELEKENFLEERIFVNSKDFSLENKGIQLISILENKNWIEKYIK